MIKQKIFFAVTKPAQKPIKELRNRKGLTLLEVLIVLGIVAGLFALGLPRLRGRDNLRTVAREISVLTREIRLQARVQQSTYRLVFDLSNPLEPHYWVEKARGQIKPQEMKLQSLEQRSDAAKAREQDPSLAEKEPPSPFQVDTKILKEPKSPPRSIKIVAVDVQRAKVYQPESNLGFQSARDEATTESEGLRAIHFSPQGLVELATIQIEGAGGQIWTLILNPLTGQTSIVTRAVTLEELKNQ